jgi:hypothetical protein
VTEENYLKNQDNPSGGFIGVGSSDESGRMVMRSE